jgi:hypothetical protein
MLTLSQRLSKAERKLTELYKAESYSFSMWSAKKKQFDAMCMNTVADVKAMVEVKEKVVEYYLQYQHDTAAVRRKERIVNSLRCDLAAKQQAEG